MRVTKWKTCALIYNPNSGKTLKLRHIKDYRKILKRGYDLTVYRTEYRGHAREIVII